MAKFHDLLLEELKRRQLRDDRVPEARRRRMVPLLAGAAGLAVAAALAVALLGLSVLFPTDSSAAYAVTSNPDGSVTVTLHDVNAITRANKALRDRHLRIVLVRQERTAARIGGCPAQQTSSYSVLAQPQVPHGWVTQIGPDAVRIRPRAVPLDTTLFLHATPDGDGARLVSFSAVVVSCTGMP